MNAERRIAPRMEIAPLEVIQFTSLDHRTLISRAGVIVDASATGFLLCVKREDLVPKEFRESLSLHALEGDQVLIKISQLNLEIGGRVARTKRVDKEDYEIAIDYSADAPAYWRDCLMELLPRPGELD